MINSVYCLALSVSYFVTKVMYCVSFTLGIFGTETSRLINESIDRNIITNHFNNQLIV